MTIQIKNADTIRTDFIKFLRSAIEENDGPNVTDYNVGSVLNVLVEAFADVLENYYFDLFQVTKNSLENIYNGFNFYKIPGKKAITTLSIYVDASLAELSSIDYFNIPRGTKVKTDDGAVQFEIIDDYNTSALSISVSGEFSGKAVYTVGAICTEIGVDGNVAANAITDFSTNITNVNNFSYWIRNTSASGGSTAEEEADMKIRFQKYLVSLRRGTKESLEYALETNAAFTGLLYSISDFKFLNIVKQYSTSIDTGNYDLDMTYFNKFYPSYTLLDSSDSAGSDRYYIYIGSEEKFNNILFSTQSVPAVTYYVASNSGLSSGGIQYYDSATQSWRHVTMLNADFTNDYEIHSDQYFTWEVDATRWGKFQVRDYNSYFIRICILKDPLSVNLGPLDVYKTMTYPFPGYVDIYCLKNYRDAVTNDDKTIISESIDNFKAAGVITNIATATVTQVHPLIIIHTNNLTKSLVPSDIVESIRTDIIEFSNTKSIGVDFVRNDLYAYLYSKYSQYGNLYIYYRYDPSIYEDFANDIFKEGFRDSTLDASVNEKIDVLLSDVYVISNLNLLVNTLTGYKYADNVGNYHDYYQDPNIATATELFLAY